MTPSKFKARYESLNVPLADGSTAQVRVNRYRLRSSTKFYNAVATEAFMAKLRARTPHAPIRIDAGPTTFRTVKTSRDSSFTVSETTTTAPQPVDSGFMSQLGAMSRYVFAGKGAPEHCQIVLRLAHEWGLASNGLQRYADEALGLDCNGFVGNYLWHVKKGIDWQGLGLRSGDLGPDALISSYFRGKKLLSSWEEIDPSRSHILGMVDADGNIMSGGPNAKPGHIAITEPNRSRPPTQYKAPAIWTVESTAARDPGLSESWYSLISVDPKTKVFKLFREEASAGSNKLPFKIAALD